MDLFTLKIVASAIIITITIAGGYLPFARKIHESHSHDFPVGESLASGVFFGAGLLHMLADSNEGFEHLGYEYPFAQLLAAVVFMLLLFLEHLSVKIEKSSKDSFAYLALVIFSIHAFLAGASLGVTVHAAVTVVVFLAIAGHKWAESLAVAIKLNQASFSTVKSLTLFGLFSLMVPLGIFIGEQVTAHMEAVPVLEPIFMGMAAGTFIYLGTIHEFKHSAMIYRCGNYKLYGYMMSGFVIMAVVAIWT